MKKITTEAIKDYQTCPLLFSYRHMDKLPEKIQSRDLYIQRFENTIKSVINYFFYKKQGGLSPSYASLLNRWEKLWFQKETTAYDIIHEQHESFYGNNSSLTSKAAAVLLDFYNFYSEDDGIPMAIDENFFFPINNKIGVNGVFDLILFKDKKYYVYKWIFNLKNSNAHLYQVDFSVVYQGFKYKFPEKINQAVFGYYDINSGNKKFAEHSINNDDIKALNFWCKTLEEDDKMVPRRNLTPYCKKCPFDKPCSNWKGWE